MMFIHQKVNRPGWEWAMVILAVENSLCEGLWALFGGKIYCNKFGTSVVGNHMQPAWDGMRLILAVCCVGQHVYVPMPTRSLLQKRNSTRHWSSLQRVVNMPPARWAYDLNTRRTAPKKLQSYSLLRISGCNQVRNGHSY